MQPYLERHLPAMLGPDSELAADAVAVMRTCHMRLAERSQPLSARPSTAAILAPRELRDLVAFLPSLGAEARIEPGTTR